MSLIFNPGALAEGFSRELSATPAEFERDLRKAWPAGVVRESDHRFCVEDGPIRLVIQVEVIGVRKIGLLELPRLAAHYVFSGGDEAARRQLLTRLDRAMQRGGG